MKPQEFIAFAGRITAKMAENPDRAAIRSAASRSYYGAFHMALEVLGELECAPRGDNHGYVRNILSSSGNADAVDASAALSFMHSARIKADYRLSETKIETVLFARVSVEMASTFTAKLDAFKTSCLNDAFRQQFVTAMREYCETTGITIRR